MHFSLCLMQHISYFPDILSLFLQSTTGKVSSFREGTYRSADRLLSEEKCSICLQHSPSTISIAPV